MIMYTIDTGYANAGIIVDEQGYILEAAPIFKWMIGKEINTVLKWKKIKWVYEHKGPI